VSLALPDYWHQTLSLPFILSHEPAICWSKKGSFLALVRIVVFLSSPQSMLLLYLILSLCFLCISMPLVSGVVYRFTPCPQHFYPWIPISFIPVLGRTYCPCLKIPISGVCDHSGHPVSCEGCLGERWIWIGTIALGRSKIKTGPGYCEGSWHGARTLRVSPPGVS
jgi:hypothetical protein